MKFTKDNDELSTSTRVTPEAFVTAYVKHGGNRRAIAQDLNVSVTTVTLRAKKYREKGVKLPKQRQATRLDITGLNSLIKDLRSRK